MLNLISKVAVKRADNADAPATLTNIMEGVDGSSVFGYAIEPIAINVEDNQQQHYAEDHTLDIRIVNEDSQTAVLSALQAGGFPTLLSAHTPNGFLIWNTPSKITKNTQFDGVLADAVLMTIRSVKGYQGSGVTRKKAVYAGGNALALYDVTNGAGMGADGQMSPNIFFPFPGTQITASAQVSAGTGNIGFSFYQANGSTLVSNSNSAVTAGTRSVHTTTIPSNTVFIRMTMGADVTYTEPMIGMGTNSVFTL